jgi:hypothetical protein
VQEQGKGQFVAGAEKNRGSDWSRRRGGAIWCGSREWQGKGQCLMQKQGKRQCLVQEQRTGAVIGTEAGSEAVFDAGAE